MKDVGTLPLRPRRRAVGLALAVAACASLGPPIQAQEDDEGIELFEEVDPHTQGDPERMADLGYVSFGPFAWIDETSTVRVAQTLGGTPVLWVETEHFCIGSTLGTYVLPGDDAEDDRIQEELKRLKRRLGRLKHERGELDPWLRLHLYAQRCEALYQQFHQRFGLDPEAYLEHGPHLGSPEKFRLLLCARESEFDRFLSTHLEAEAQNSFRWYPSDGALGIALDVESMLDGFPPDPENPIPYDTIVHAAVTSGLAHTFLDAYRSNRASTPIWLRHAYGHYEVRKLDPRWVNGFGLKRGRTIEPDDYQWEGRVDDLLRNDFYPDLSQVFAWSDYKQLTVRDHMTTWSRLEYLLDEVDGDHAGFLDALLRPTPATEVPAPPSATEQLQAFEVSFELDPEAFDKQWQRWVRREYRRR